MKQHSIFIDGQEGTTGLEITQRLARHPAVRLLTIDPALRKDPAERSRLMAQAELVFLCLPDAAAREAAQLAIRAGARVIDASTAHRTTTGWVYGLPELSAARRADIAAAQCVANPGCYATGFVSLVQPLVAAGILPGAAPLSCHAVSGYSGGGKGMIADYEGAAADAAASASDTHNLPHFYALGQGHKHLPEMQQQCALQAPPVFVPSVGNFYRGMLVFVPLHTSQLTQVGGAQRVWQTLAAQYDGQRFVQVLPFDDGQNGGKMLTPDRCADTNALHLAVYGNNERMVLCAALDNLGKGASGAAVQNMNLMLGLPEDMALENWADDITTKNGETV